MPQMLKRLLFKHILEIEVLLLSAGWLISVLVLLIFISLMGWTLKFKKHNQVEVGRLLNCVWSLGMICRSYGMFFWRKRTCWWLNARCLMLRTCVFLIQSVFPRWAPCVVVVWFLNHQVFIEHYLHVSSRFSSWIWNKYPN